MKRYLPLFLLSTLVILLDQWTKSLVRNFLPIGGDWVPFPALPFFRIVHWYNSGAAFGLFQNGGLFFTIVAIFVAMLIIYYYPRLTGNDWLLRLALGLQLGGAIGNLIDRLQMGMVTDFIAVGSFPVFNLADSSITIGTGLLLLGSWLYERRQKSLSASESYGTPGDAPIQQRDP